MQTTDQPTPNTARRFVVKRRLTSGNVRGGAPTSRWYATPVQIIARDLAVIRHVGAFNQLTTRHIADMLFHEKSKSTYTAVLKRLLAHKYLYRLARFPSGGAQGGSPQYVYALGPEGWRMFSTKRWYPPRAVNYHTLKIADAYTATLEYERAGRLTIERVSTEPESHERVGGVELRPDLRLDLGINGNLHAIALEIDMGTEGKEKILDKLKRYDGAYWQADEGEFAPVPIFIAPDADRVKWLRQTIEGAGYADQQGTLIGKAYEWHEFPAILL